MTTENPAAMHALVLTTDPWLGSVFTKITPEFGIAARIMSTADAVSDEVNRAKYDTMVLDFDTVFGTPRVLGAVRSSRSNRTVVVFAVATDPVQKRDASRDGASFFLHRPIDVIQVRRGLSAAYSSILNEHRRYFRCAVELPVVLARNDSESLECVTTNVSSNGIGIKTPLPLQPGEALKLTLTLPDGLEVRALGRVIWDDRHGKSGLNFEFINPGMQLELDAWLDSQFSFLQLSAN